MAGRGSCASFFSCIIGLHWPLVDASGLCLYPNHLDLGASLLPISDVIHLPPLAHINHQLFLVLPRIPPKDASLTHLSISPRIPRRHLRPRFSTSCAGPPSPTSRKPASWPITRRRQSRPWGTGHSNRPSVCSIKAGWLGWTMTAGHGILPQVTQASKARSFHHRPPIQW